MKSLMLIIVIYYITIFSFTLVRSSHFYGGTVTWKPMNNTASNSTIPVMFIQSYQWRRSLNLNTQCPQSAIVNQSPLMPVTGNLFMCVTTPTSLCGGFSSISIDEYCTDTSIIRDSSSGQTSTVKNIIVGSKFCVAFKSTYWIPVQTNCPTNASNASNTTTLSTTTIPTCNNSAAGWSVGCCIDLSIRLDGFINTPPTVTIMSPISVSVNSTINIKIPVIDADSDVVRCRWAHNSSTLDECGGVCGITSGSTLSTDDCTLTFDSTGKAIGNYYAIALTIEDFYNASSNTPLSSVPLQLLIKIVVKPNCPSKSIISTVLSVCTNVKVGVQYNFTLTITQGCSNTSINEFFRMPPLYMYKSNITQIGTSNVWTVTETWIPTVRQIGSQVYCAIAIDSNNIQSDQYCLTFTVFPVGQAPICTTTTTDSMPASLVTVLTVDNSKSISLGLGLGLGLGLPLLLFLTSLLIYNCCYEKLKVASKRCFHRLTKHNRNVDSPTDSTQSINDSMNNKEYLQNESADYRHQYINDDHDYRQQYINDVHDSPVNSETNISNEIDLLTELRTFTSTSVSELEFKSMNATRTTLFSPSACSLPTVDVQDTKDHSLPTPDSIQRKSILIRAYSVQESRKSYHT